MDLRTVAPCLTRAGPPYLLCVPFLPQLTLPEQRQCCELASPTPITPPPKKTRWAGMEAGFGGEVRQSSFSQGHTWFSCLGTLFGPKPPLLQGCPATHPHPLLPRAGQLREALVGSESLKSSAGGGSPVLRQSKRRPDSPLPEAKRQRAAQPPSQACSRLTGKEPLIR